MFIYTQLSFSSQHSGKNTNKNFKGDLSQCLRVLVVHRTLLPWTPDTHVGHRHTFRKNTHTHKMIKENLKKIKAKILHHVSGF